MLSIVFSEGAERVMPEMGESVDCIAPVDVMIYQCPRILRLSLILAHRLTCSFNPDRYTNSEVESNTEQPVYKPHL